MSDKRSQTDTQKQKEAPVTPRKSYEKPVIKSSESFEKQALACPPRAPVAS